MTTANTAEAGSTGAARVETLSKDQAFDPRKNNIDFLRLALAVAVIVSHSFLLIDATYNRDPIVRIFPQNRPLGWLAVDGFFILSGFLIAQSWERGRGVVDFFKKRACRIYPGFIVACLLGTYAIPHLVGGPNAAAPPVTKVAMEIARLRGECQPDVFTMNPLPGVNGSMWSIAFEWWCYVAVAVLGLTGLLRRRWLLAALLVVLLVPAWCYWQGVWTWAWPKPWTFWGATYVWRGWRRCTCRVW
ncbi:MAG: acyltransferase [Tepidisphaeraceae bacterium]